MCPLQAAKPEEVFFPLLKTMLVQGLMTGEATECGVEVIGLVAHTLHIGWGVAKNRCLRVVAADMRYLEKAGLPLGAVAEFRGDDAHLRPLAQ